MTPPTRSSRAALVAALALTALGCPRWMGNRYALSLLEERWIRVGPTQVVEREEVAKRLQCQGGGTPEASCDFDRVWGLYDRRGHPQARFSLRRIEDRDGHAQHEVVVDEGPYFWVERVRVDGMEGLPAARAWTDALPLRAGGPFSVYVYMQNKDELLAALHGAGHGRAEVFERMEPDLRASVPGSYAVVARYDVDPGRPGEPWPLGTLEFWEPDPARKARIEREAAPLLRTGEPFDYAQLADFRARLRRKYPTAEVLVGKPDEARRQVQVMVRVPRR